MSRGDVRRAVSLGTRVQVEKKGAEASFGEEKAQASLRTPK